MVVKGNNYFAFIVGTKHILFAIHPFWTIIKFVKVHLKPGYYRMYVGYLEIEVGI